MNAIMTRLNENKKRATAIFAIAMLMMVSTLSVGAAGTADTATVTGITAAFDDVQATALAVVGAIAAVAILLFAGPYAWQYGKKIFKTVAR